MRFEMEAWAWLLNLPRMVIGKKMTLRQWRQWENQIRIRVCPGKLYTNKGAPMIKITARHPQSKKRFLGTGNSLRQAADRLHGEFWRAGIQLPFIFEKDKGPNQIS